MDPHPVAKPSVGLYVAILEKARHQKSARALQHIKDACDYLDQKEIEITIAEVGHFCKKTGPKTQSIHNNKDYGAYIKARHAEQKLTVTPSTGEVKFETKDPQANAVIYALQSEVRRLEKNLRNFKGALVDAGEYDLEATMRTGRLVRMTEDKPAAPSAEVLEVLNRLLDPNHLVMFGLRFLHDRIIAVDRNSRVFMEKADLHRLRELTQTNSAINGAKDGLKQIGPPEV